MIKTGDYLRICLERTGNIAMVGVFEITAMDERTGTYKLQFRDIHRDDPAWNPYLGPEELDGDKGTEKK